MAKKTFFQGKKVSAEWAVVLNDAAKRVTFQLNSGRRTLTEQWFLWNHRGQPGFASIVAFPNPNAPHIRVGRINHALDVDTNVGRGENALQAELKRMGLNPVNNVAGEPWHLDEQDSGRLKRAAAKVVASADVGTPTLRKGASNPAAAVRRLQHLLRARNLKGVPLNGKYDLRTRQAVFRFKRKHGLSHDSVAGRKVWKLLLALAHGSAGTAHAAKDQPLAARGLDVSNLQGSIDFIRVRGAGYRFVYVKAGEGDWKDPWFLKNVRNATAAGLRVGAYHFLRPKPGRTGGQEAAFFVAQLRAAKLDKGDLMPALDVESTTLGVAQTRQYVKAFADALRKAGYRPLIYTGTWFWDPKVDSTDSFGCPLWIAAYQSQPPRLPKAWKHYVIWQFTDKASVPGIGGHVDANKCPDLRKVIA